METIISKDDRIAIAEVDYIIHHMNERYLNKIPQKVRDYITILKKRNINIYVDPHVPLENQGLKEFTLYFLIILNLKYWCNDERRKEIILMLENNQRKYEEKINNIFDNANAMEGDAENITSRPVNQPRQITVAENTSEDVKEEVIEEQKEEKVVSEGTSALDELAKEAEAMTKLEEPNFLMKFFNKIKSFFVKK